MADTVGKRPVPGIAGGGKVPGKADPHGGTDKSRTSATKTPTGSRPVPGIARNTPPHPPVPGAVKAPIKHTPMPTPNRDRLTGKGKSEGGGSY